MTERMTTAEINETARDIVTGKLLVAELDREEWRMSLMLLLGGLPKPELEKIGLVLVPMAPHHHMYWINGIAPGCSVQATLVHRNDVDRLTRESARMLAALEPQTEASDG